MNHLCTENLIIETTGEELEHLSEYQLVDLINKYKRGERLEKLLEEFAINIRPTMLVRAFPLVRVGKCPNCPADLACSIANKSSKELLNNRKQECWNCGHKPDVFNCQCLKCISRRREEEIQTEINTKNELQIKRKAIEKEYNTENYKNIEEDDLSVQEKFFLCAILRCCLSDDGKYVKPINTSLEPISSHQELTTQMIRHLTGRKILIPSFNSDINAFIFDENNSPARYYTYEVNYLLNVQSNDTFSLLVERLLYLTEDIHQHLDDFLEIWKDLAFHEVMSYYLNQMAEVGYEPSIGEITKTTFQKLLETFSVGQIFNIIFRAVANSTRAYQSREYTKKHAMNMVVASCRNQGERAIAENWDLKSYGRIKQLPESELSRLLFTSLLKKPNQGFYNAPTIENLKKLINEEESLH